MEGPLLERDTELNHLHRLLDSLESAGGRLVLIRGEAGVGKSVFVTRFLDLIADRAHTLLGFCDDLLTPQPLGPVWDIARRDSSLQEPLERGDRRAVMETLLDLMSRRLRSTVIVLEDVQWADEATLDVTRFLGRRIDAANGLLILTYRDGEVDNDHPLRQVIGGLPPGILVRIHLEPLTAAAVAGIADESDSSVDEIMALTGGNPLFVTELIAEGLDHVPASIRDSILARSAKLSVEARQLLCLVSVIPGRADRRLIDSMLHPGLGRLAECERQGLLRVTPETIRFRHELARRACESSLSAAERQALNRRVLRALPRRTDPALLVHHASEANDIEAIIDHAPRAAQAAMAVESHRQALDHFRLLRPHLSRFPERERAAILEDWALVESFHGSTEGALRILELAVDLYRSIGPDRALARVLTLAARLSGWNRHHREADAYITEAVAILDRCPPGADLARAVSRRAWLEAMRMEWRAAHERADRAIGIARSVGDDLALVDALNTKGVARCALQDHTGLEILEDCRRRAEKNGFLVEESRAVSNAAYRAIEFLEFDRAMDWAQQARDLGLQHEIPTNVAHAWAEISEILEWMGDWAAAEDAALEALALVPAADVLEAVGTLAKLQARSGRPEAPATLDLLWSTAEASGGVWNAETQAAAAVTAEYLWLTDTDDPAKTTVFPELLAGITDHGFPVVAGRLAFWMWKLGLLATAPGGIAEPYRLVIEDRPSEAAAVWERKGVPYERALALMHGDDTEQLEAVRILDGLGASLTAERLRRLLLDRGMRVPRGLAKATRRHPAGLTARQAEVLELLAEGLTSPQIADRLFIASRTVENHVAAILMKLDVTDRHTAVDTAREFGLISAT